MLLGQSILNGEPREGTGTAFQGLDPAAGTRLDPVYHSVSVDDVDMAARLADDAFATYSKLSGAERARFLRHIAAGIEAITAEVVERAHRETALPVPRLQGEVGRTVNQLRLFAQVVEEGSWAMARIDPRNAGAQAAASRRYPLGAAADRAGCGLWIEQFSAGVFRGGRRYGIGAGGGKSGDREGAFGASGHERDGGAGDREQREGVRVAGGRLCAALRLGFGGGLGAGGASEREGCRLYGLAPCGQVADATGGGAAGADPLLHGDEQHQSVYCAAGGAADTRARRLRRACSGRSRWAWGSSAPSRDWCFCLATRMQTRWSRGLRRA